MNDLDIYFRNNPLLKECVDDLHAQIFSYESSIAKKAIFYNMVTLTDWGKVDWTKINNKIYVGCNSELIIPSLQKLLNNNDFDKKVCIIWSDPGSRAIETSLDAVIKNFDSVTCVAPEKFIFNPTQGYIIEIRTGDDTTVGVIK